MTAPQTALPGPPPREAVLASPLSGRLVLAVGDGRSAAQTGGSTARSGASGVFVEGLPRLFANHLVSNETDTGIGVLAPYREFAAAARALIDDLLDPGSPGWVVESVPAGIPLEIATALYPDAHVVRSDDELHDALATPAPHGGPGHQRARSPEGLILVVGAPRSGTTWLEQMLLAHPDAGGVPKAETWLFRGITGFWENHRGGGLADLTNEAGLADALHQFCARLFATCLAAQGDRRWFVEKTPNHVYLLPEIARVWPEVYVISIVRDGRDVARSAAQLHFGSHDIIEAARAWSTSVRAAAAAGEHLERLRHVRYKDLLADPVGVMAELFDWIGLDAAAAEEPVRAAAAVRVSKHNTTGAVGSGKWRTLPPADLRIVLATAGDELVAEGYAEAEDVERARRQLRRPIGWLAERFRRLRVRGRPSGALISRGESRVAP